MKQFIKTFDYEKEEQYLTDMALRGRAMEEFKDALKWAMNLGGPAVLDCMIDAGEKVWPMVAPGASLMDTFSEEDIQK